MVAVERKRFPFGTRYADLADWFEALPGGLPFGPEGRFIRIEEGQEDGAYVVRAELPGIDPEKDLELTVDQGVLTVRAERSEKSENTHRSEFRYGSFTRSVTLPTGVREEDVSAEYDKGVLTVRAPLREDGGGARRVNVRHRG